MSAHAVDDPPRPPDPSVTGRPADLGWRFLARLLDAVVVGLPASALVAILGLPAPTIGLGGMDVWTRSAVTVGLWLAYHVIFEWQFRGTVGKRLLRLDVLSHEVGGRPGT